MNAQPIRSALARHKSGRTATPEETLVRDHRAGLSPAQMVERKLLFLLRGNSLPMSLGQMSSVLRLRPPCAGGPNADICPPG
jgi:hypothetical protein